MKFLTKSIWVSSQKTGPKNKPMFWSGRAWLHVDGKSFGMNIEWSHGKHATIGGLEIDVAGDDHPDITVMIGIPNLFLYFFSIRGILPRQWRRKIEHEYRGRSTGIVIAEDHVSLHLWHSEGIYSEAGIYRGLFIKDLLLGMAKYSERHLTPLAHMQVELPEAKYDVTIRLNQCTWKRPRWPWPTVITRAEIDIPGGIPIPGDGENDWDQDDDAIYSLTVPAASFEEAVQKLIANVNRDRKGWTP